MPKIFKFGGNLIWRIFIKFAKSAKISSFKVAVALKALALLLLDEDEKENESQKDNINTGFAHG